MWKLVNLPSYRIVFASSLLLLSAACSAGVQPAVVNTELARQTLHNVLASWKQGESPDQWRKRDPEVVVQDMDWMGGAKLLSYELIGAGEARDANLHCQVKLTLKKANGESVNRTVTYVVGTDPVCTVMRGLD